MTKVQCLAGAAASPCVEPYKQPFKVFAHE